MEVALQKNDSSCKTNSDAGAKDVQLGRCWICWCIEQNQFQYVETSFKWGRNPFHDNRGIYSWKHTELTHILTWTILLSLQTFNILIVFVVTLGSLCHDICKHNILHLSAQLVQWILNFMWAHNELSPIRKDLPSDPNLMFPTDLFQPTSLQSVPTHLNLINPQSVSGKCMWNVGVRAGDSRDFLGQKRFFPFSPENVLIGQKKALYIRITCEPKRTYMTAKLSL